MMWCVSAKVRQVACLYTRVLSQAQCAKAALWQRAFSQKLANVRLGEMNAAYHPNAIDVVRFPNCSSAVFHVEGSVTVCLSRR